MRDDVRILVRVSLSITHIQSAALISRLGHAVEQQFAGTYNVNLDEQNQAYAIAAIFGATSFLEATVNELFSDAASQPNNTRFQGIPANQVTQLARYVNSRHDWETFKQGKNRAYRTAGTFGNEILNKLQFATVSLGQPELTETDPEFTDARLLIDVRNKLTHFEPETVAVHDSEGPVTLQQISQRLAGKFAENPFAVAGGHTMFPNLYLSHGASQWSVLRAFAIADKFFDHVHLPRPYDHVRNNCATQ